MLNDTPDTLNLKDLMRVLKVGRGTALRLLNEGTIDGHKVGGKWLVFKEDVAEFIERS